VGASPFFCLYYPYYAYIRVIGLYEYCSTPDPVCQIGKSRKLNLGRWTACIGAQARGEASEGGFEADFIQTMCSGISPHGQELDPEFMPWDVYANVSDEELKSLWIYLQSLPAASRAD
jgi:hypothetical protein